MNNKNEIENLNIEFNDNIEIEYNEDFSSEKTKSLNRMGESSQSMSSHPFA
jgi:hypothetical protein